MRAIWVDNHPHGNFDGFPWPKGMTYDQSATLRDPDRILVARIKGEAAAAAAAADADSFHGYKVSGVLALSGDDAKRLGAAIENATRDVPLRADEWTERFAVRVEARAQNGNLMVSDLLVAPQHSTMIVMDRRDKRMCTVVKELENVLAALLPVSAE